MKSILNCGNYAVVYVDISSRTINPLLTNTFAVVVLYLSLGVPHVDFDTSLAVIPIRGSFGASEHKSFEFLSQRRTNAKSTEFNIKLSETIILCGVMTLWMVRTLTVSSV